jgi:hypothetical protein
MFQVNALAGNVPSSGSVPSPEYEITSPATKNPPSCGEVIVAVGGLPTLIETGVENVEFTPSETDTRAEYTPGCAYVWLGLAAVDVPPSPNVHAYVSGCPSGSDEPALEKLTASGAGPPVGFADATATGA